MLPFVDRLGQPRGEAALLSAEMRKPRLEEVISTSSQVQGTSGCWSGSQIPGFSVWAQLGPCRRLPPSRWAQLLLLQVMPRRCGHRSIQYCSDCSADLLRRDAALWGGGSKAGQGGKKDMELPQGRAEALQPV